MNSSKVRLDKFDASMGLNRGANKLQEMLWYGFKLLFFLSGIPYPNTLKRKILKLFGAKVGVGVVIKPRVNIHMPWKLEIGDHVWIGEEASLLNFELLKIGNHVCISQRVFLCGGNHDFKDPTMPYRNGPIELKDGCWIGANTFIAPNVNVGYDSIVTVGSVVTTTLPANGIFRGNPAQYLKPRWNAEELNSTESLSKKRGHPSEIFNPSIDRSLIR